MSKTIKSKVYKRVDGPQQGAVPKTASMVDELTQQIAKQLATNEQLINSIDEILGNQTQQADEGETREQPAPNTIPQVMNIICEQLNYQHDRLMRIRDNLEGLLGDIKLY